MKRKGFTLVELLVVIAIIGILASLLLPALASVMEKAKQTQCRANLNSMGKSMELYVQDCGKNIYYPNSTGATFVVTLYAENFLSEAKSFICPSTPDNFTDPDADDDIAYSKDVFDANFNVNTGDTEANNYTSYTGRQNRNPDPDATRGNYPIIYKFRKNISSTPIAADDNQLEDNHEEGTIVLFLYMDGHVDGTRHREGVWAQYDEAAGNEVRDLINPLYDDGE